MNACALLDVATSVFPFGVGCDVAVEELEGCGDGIGVGNVMNGGAEDKYGVDGCDIVG